MSEMIKWEDPTSSPASAGSDMENTDFPDNVDRFLAHVLLNMKENICAHRPDENCSGLVLDFEHRISNTDLTSTHTNAHRAEIYARCARVAAFDTSDEDAASCAFEAGLAAAYAFDATHYVFGAGTSSGTFAQIAAREAAYAVRYAAISYAAVNDAPAVQALCERLMDNFVAFSGIVTSAAAGHD